MSHPEEHVVVFEPDHATRAVELLLFQHQQRERLKAFARALAAGAQLAEATSWAVIVGASVLGNAEGYTLDRWGEIVGEFRGGLDHEQFVRFINLRIRVNTEHPGDEAMASIVVAAVDPSTVTAYVVADGIVYQVASATFLPGAVAAHAGALVRDFRPAGIYVAVTESTPDSFDFGSVAVPGDIFGSVASPGPVFGRLIYSGRG